MSDHLDKLARVASAFIRQELRQRRQTPETICPTCGRSITIRSLHGRQVYLNLHKRLHARPVRREE